MQESDYVLELKNITKQYPGVIALNDVSLDLKKGEVHALVGENGAGKSTLIKSCSGAVIPDKGKICIEGQEYSRMTPQLSVKSGIAIIYQEFNLVGDLSVAENIFLGREIRKGILVDKKTMVEEARKQFEKLHIQIDPRAMVKDLTVGYQQMVEIAKAVSQNAKVLIMDEPSAPLTSVEVENMLQMVEFLRGSGVSVIYISHRLDEVFRLADRITVLRDGQKIKTLSARETNVQELITLMVGRELKEIFPERRVCIQDEVLFEARNICGNGDQDISFKIRKGEILGLGGLVGAGRTELAEMIFGIAPVTGGSFYLRGEEYIPKSPTEAIRHGVALVPEDRKKHGAVLGMEIQSNITMPILPKISRVSVIDKKREKEIAESYRQEIQIKTPTLHQLVNNLSGGNQQKVILAKWLAAEAELIILDEPTRGIDVGAKYEIYKLMNALVENGKTILLISSEMEELLGMSDRIAVLAEGKLTGIVEKSEFDQQAILRYASKAESEAVEK